MRVGGGSGRGEREGGVGGGSGRGEREGGAGGGWGSHCITPKMVT